MSYDYPSRIATATAFLAKLQGAVLRQVLVQTVQDEFNIVYLRTSLGYCCIHGDVGGEYLGIRPVDKMPEKALPKGIAVRTFAPFVQFENMTISQARQIGTAWSGHGFEFNFESMHETSMLIQSIYCGSKPEGLEDCLRLGVGNYQNTYRG